MYKRNKRESCLHIILTKHYIILVGKFGILGCTCWTCPKDPFNLEEYATPKSLIKVVFSVNIYLFIKVSAFNILPFALYFIPFSFQPWPFTFYILPLTFFLSPLTFYHLHFAFYLLSFTLCLLPFAFFLSFNFFPFTFYLLLFTSYLLPFSFYH